METIEIKEIGERSITGVSSRPFKCKADDGNSYYVKLGNAIPDEKINEWIFGFLAMKMGLPTPIGAIVIVDSSLSKQSMIDTTEFGYGIGFGSKEFPNSIELSSQSLTTIDSTLQSEILLFDWWIRNEDRKLGQLGGNPNLLINNHNEITLIDQGNAIDHEFCVESFFSDHAMSGSLKLWQDTAKQKDWLSRATNALKHIEPRWNSLPEEWLNQGATLTLEEITKTLEKPFKSSNDFWQPFK